jgi:hypothetical protein
MGNMIRLNITVTRGSNIEEFHTQVGIVIYQKLAQYCDVSQEYRSCVFCNQSTHYTKAS